MSREKAISFNLLKVTTEQFATISDPPSNDESINLATRFRFGFDPANRNIGVFIQFTFSESANSFLQIEGGCHFQIEKTDWDSLANEGEKTITLPKGFASHLLMLCVGTTRGLLHSKTENTPYNKYLIPLINVANFVEKDVVLNIEEPSPAEEISSSPK